MRSPVKSYSKAGTYDISLNVYNNYDSLLISKPACVIVHDSVISIFEADVREGHAPLTVKFTSLSKGDIQTYSWDFGDGVLYSDKAPTYTYTKPGSYYVILDVHDNYYGSWKKVPDYIKVLDPLDVSNSTTSTQSFRIINVSENKIVFNFNTNDNIPNSIIIYDIFGNVFERFENLSANGSKIKNFELRNKLISGVYFVKVMINNNILTGKFIYTGS